MSLAFDRDCALDGNHLKFFRGSAQSYNLEPQQVLTVRTEVLGGRLTAFVESLDLAQPFRTHVVGGHLDPVEDDGSGSVIEEWQHVAVKVELRVDGVSDPVKTWWTPQGWFEEDEVQLDRTYDTGAFPDDPQARRLVWTLRVVKTSNRRVRCQAGLSGAYARYPLETSHIAQRLVNHATKVVLEALTIRGRILGQDLVLEVGAELLNYISDVEGAPLGTIVIPLDINKLPESAFGHGKLYSVDVKVRSGATLLDAVEERWNALNASFPDAIFGAIAWRDEWRSTVRPDAVTVHMQVVFADIQFNWMGIDLAEIADLTTDIYIAFTPDLRSAHTLVLSPSKFTGGLAEVAKFYGIIEEMGQYLEENLPPKIDHHAPQIGRYLAEVLLRLAVGQRVFYSASCDGLNVSVRHTLDPDLVVRKRWDDSIRPPGGMGLGRAVAIGPSATAVEIPDPVKPARRSTKARSSIPPEFVIHNSEKLERLDQIKTIVVLMMENRSFDHMLGYLRNARGSQYEGLRGNEANPPPPPVSGSQLQVRRATDEPLLDPHTSGHPRTQMMISPYHGHRHVKVQVNDGRMDGFVKDLATKPGAYPELAMVYYTDDQLHSYDAIAAQFCVADHWFAAHPGPTWPNRWATISGTTPQLENFDIDDPQFGFMSRLTIFELLQAARIDWRYFEHDVSVLRMFNAYRTNDRSLAPYDPPLPERLRKEPWETWSDDFHAVVARGDLPPVVFIDPNFVDVPPISTASDDLAPANLSSGQALVADIYNTLTQGPQWPQTLFVITYDEHGGFFDHVPPPGTPPAPPPPEFGGTIPRIHPDGPNFLGVRVPALIVTPWVSAGSVCNTVFDHTSIIKTILVRHRDRVPEEWFTMFGPRVNLANHVGAAFDLASPRTDPRARSAATSRPDGRVIRRPRCQPGMARRGGGRRTPRTAIGRTSEPPSAARWFPSPGRRGRPCLGQQHDSRPPGTNTRGPHPGTQLQLVLAPNLQANSCQHTHCFSRSL
jgi:phospholipase C